MEFSLSLSPKSSVLDNLVCKEVFDQPLLMCLLSSCLVQDDKVQLQKYLAADGQVSYHKAGKFGRVYAKGSVGLQSIRREVRHTITVG